MKASDPRARSVGLVALGVIVGLVVTFTVLRFAPRRKAPVHVDTHYRGALVVEDEGPIDELLFHYVPSLEPIVVDTYTDLFSAIDRTTRLIAVVPRGESAALQAFLQRIDPSLGARCSVVEVRGPITVWSKDRALVVPKAREGERTTLVVPTPPDPRWVERHNDWATLAQIAQKFPERFVVSELPLDFDAGDFAVTTGALIVDANLLYKNGPRGIASTEALGLLLATRFSERVVVLGDRPGDVPRHHLSMYMTPIGAGVVLVGDVRAAEVIAGSHFDPHATSPDTGEPLRPDFSDASKRRFDRAASDLARAGFRVERIPNLPFDDKTYLAYTNGVFETRGSHKIAYVPQYGFERLDAFARETYARLGFDVRPIRVRAAYPFHGTVGCLVNVLERGSGSAAPRPRTP